MKLVQRKKKGGLEIGKKEVKLTQFANGIILFVHKYSLSYHQNMLELLKHSGNTAIIGKLGTLLYANTEFLEQ